MKRGRMPWKNEYPPAPRTVILARKALLEAYEVQNEAGIIAAQKVLREYVEKLGVRSYKDYERR